MFYLKFKQQFLASDKHSALFTSVLIYRYLNLLRYRGTKVLAKMVSHKQKRNKNDSKTYK